MVMKIRVFPSHSNEYDSIIIDTDDLSVLTNQFYPYGLPTLYVSDLINDLISLISIIMKYFKLLPDGRLMLVSRTTFWRLCKSSGFTKLHLDSDGRKIGEIFVPE